MNIPGRVFHNIAKDYYTFFTQNKYIFSFVITSLILVLCLTSISEIIRICIFMNYWIFIFNIVINYENLDKLIYDATHTVFNLCLFIIFILVLHINFYRIISLNGILFYIKLFIVFSNYYNFSNCANIFFSSGKKYFHLFKKKYSKKKNNKYIIKKEHLKKSQVQPEKNDDTEKNDDNFIDNILDNDSLEFDDFDPFDNDVDAKLDDFGECTNYFENYEDLFVLDQ